MRNHIVEIIVRGELGPDLVPALDEYSVTIARGRTTIVGAVPDQSRLLGLLGMFDDLHIEVLSVSTIDDDAAG